MYTTLCWPGLESVALASFRGSFALASFRDCTGLVLVGLEAVHWLCWHWLHSEAVWLLLVWRLCIGFVQGSVLTLFRGCALALFRGSVLALFRGCTGGCALALLRLLSRLEALHWLCFETACLEAVLVLFRGEHLKTLVEVHKETNPFVHFLGYAQGLHPLPDKVKAIVDAPALCVLALFRGTSFVYRLCDWPFFGLMHWPHWPLTKGSAGLV